MYAVGDHVDSGSGVPGDANGTGPCTSLSQPHRNEATAPNGRIGVAYNPGDNVIAYVDDGSGATALKQFEAITAHTADSGTLPPWAAGTLYNVGDQVSQAGKNCEAIVHPHRFDDGLGGPFWLPIVRAIRSNEQVSAPDENELKRWAALQTHISTPDNGPARSGCLRRSGGKVEPTANAPDGQLGPTYWQEVPTPDGNAPGGAASRHVLE